MKRRPQQTAHVVDQVRGKNGSDPFPFRTNAGMQTDHRRQNTSAGVSRGVAGPRTSIAVLNTFFHCAALSMANPTPAWEPGATDTVRGRQKHAHISRLHTVYAQQLGSTAGGLQAHGK